jgi:hypothetical protein
MFICVKKITRERKRISAGRKSPIGRSALDIQPLQSSCFQRVSRMLLALTDCVSRLTILCILSSKLLFHTCRGTPRLFLESLTLQRDDWVLEKLAAWVGINVSVSCQSLSAGHIGYEVLQGGERERHWPSTTHLIYCAAPGRISGKLFLKSSQPLMDLRTLCLPL